MDKEETAVILEEHVYALCHGIEMASNHMTTYGWISYRLFKGAAPVHTLTACDYLFIKLKKIKNLSFYDEYVSLQTFSKARVQVSNFCDLNWNHVLTFPLSN